MKYDARWMRAIFPFLFAVLLAGCDRGQTLELRRWSLGSAAVELPAHLRVG